MELNRAAHHQTPLKVNLLAWPSKVVIEVTYTSTVWSIQNKTAVASTAQKGLHQPSRDTPSWLGPTGPLTQMYCSVYVTSQ